MFLKELVYPRLYILNMMTFTFVLYVLLSYHRPTLLFFNAKRVLIDR